MSATDAFVVLPPRGFGEGLPPVYSHHPNEWEGVGRAGSPVLATPPVQGIGKGLVTGSGVVTGGLPSQVSAHHPVTGVGPGGPARRMTSPLDPPPSGVLSWLRGRKGGENSAEGDVDEGGARAWHPGDLPRDLQPGGTPPGVFPGVPTGPRWSDGPSEQREPRQPNRRVAELVVTIEEEDERGAGVPEGMSRSVSAATVSRTGSLLGMGLGKGRGAKGGGKGGGAKRREGGKKGGLFQGSRRTASVHDRSDSQDADSAVVAAAEAASAATAASLVAAGALPPPKGHLHRSTTSGARRPGSAQAAFTQAGYAQAGSPQAGSAQAGSRASVVPQYFPLSSSMNAPGNVLAGSAGDIQVGQRPQTSGGMLDPQNWNSRSMQVPNGVPPLAGAWTQQKTTAGGVAVSYHPLTAVSPGGAPQLEGLPPVSFFESEESSMAEGLPPRQFDAREKRHQAEHIQQEQGWPEEQQQPEKEMVAPLPGGSDSMLHLFLPPGVELAKADPAKQVEPLSLQEAPTVFELGPTLSLAGPTEPQPASLEDGSTLTGAQGSGYQNDSKTGDLEQEQEQGQFVFLNSLPSLGLTFVPEPSAGETAIKADTATMVKATATTVAESHLEERRAFSLGEREGHRGATQAERGGEIEVEGQAEGSAPMQRSFSLRGQGEVARRGQGRGLHQLEGGMGEGQGVSDSDRTRAAAPTGRDRERSTDALMRAAQSLQGQGEVSAWGPPQEEERGGDKGAKYPLFLPPRRPAEGAIMSLMAWKAMGQPKEESPQGPFPAAAGSVAVFTLAPAVVEMAPLSLPRDQADGPFSPETWASAVRSSASSSQASSSVGMVQDSNILELHQFPVPPVKEMMGEQRADRGQLQQQQLKQQQQQHLQLQVTQGQQLQRMQNQHLQVPLLQQSQQLQQRQLPQVQHQQLQQQQQQWPQPQEQEQYHEDKENVERGSEMVMVPLRGVGSPNRAQQPSWVCEEEDVGSPIQYQTLLSPSQNNNRSRAKEEGAGEGGRAGEEGKAGSPYLTRIRQWQEEDCTVVGAWEGKAARVPGAGEAGRTGGAGEARGFPHAGRDGNAVFCMGLSLGVLAMEREKQRLQRELERERDSASWLAQVAAREWQGKAEAARRCQALALEADIQAGSQYSSAQLSSCVALGLCPLCLSCPGVDVGEDPVTPAKAGDGELTQNGEKAGQGAPQEGASEHQSEEGQAKQGGGEGEGPVGVSSGQGAACDEEPCSESSDRPSLSEVERLRHHVKMLRMCLELSKQMEGKATHSAEQWKVEAERGDGLLAEQCRRNRKLMQEINALRGGSSAPTA